MTSVVVWDTKYTSDFALGLVKQHRITPWVSNVCVSADPMTSVQKYSTVLVLEQARVTVTALITPSVFCDAKSES